MHKSGKENKSMFCSQNRFCGLKSPALISSYDPNRLKAGGVRMTLARHMSYAQSSEKSATLHRKQKTKMPESIENAQKSVILHEPV